MAIQLANQQAILATHSAGRPCGIPHETVADRWLGCRLQSTFLVKARPADPLPSCPSSRCKRQKQIAHTTPATGKVHHMHLPSGKILKLNKSLYGIKQAPRQWSNLLAS